MGTLGEKFNEQAEKNQKEEDAKIKKKSKNCQEQIRKHLESKNFDRSQIDFCLSDAHYIRLLAPAGSGKTRSLLWRCKTIHEYNKLMGNSPNKKFFVVTFTRIARDELSERLTSNEDFSEIRNLVRITTLNEWGNKYLHGIERSLEIISSDSKRFSTVDHDFRRLFKGFTKKIKSFYDKTKRRWSNYIDISKVFDSMKNCGFFHEGTKKQLNENFESHRKWLKDNGLERHFNANITQKLVKLGIVEDSNTSIDGFRAFLRLWQKTCDHLWETGKITLEDQKYRSLIEFRKKYGNNHSALPTPSRYDHVLVDEFQDISPLDMLLIKTLVDIYESSLVIVGDDDQAIFEWRGATPNFILSPHDHFKKDFKTYILEINYRSPKNIVAFSHKLISHNKKREAKKFVSNLETDAEVLVKKFPTHNECLDYVLDFARKASEKKLPNQLGIIGRKKGQLIPMQIVLTSNEIPFFARQDLNVLFSKAFKDLKEILEIISAPNLGTSTTVTNSFLKLMDYVRLYPLIKKTRGRLFHHLSSNRGVSNIEGCLEHS